MEGVGRNGGRIGAKPFARESGTSESSSSDDKISMALRLPFEPGEADPLALDSEAVGAGVNSGLMSDLASGIAAASPFGSFRSLLPYFQSSVCQSKFASSTTSSYDSGTVFRTLKK